jgi:hypothetical protein
MRMLLELPEGHEQHDEFIGGVSTVTNCLTASFHLDATQEICPTNPTVYNFAHTASAFKRYHEGSEAVMAKLNGFARPNETTAAAPSIRFACARRRSTSCRSTRYPPALRFRSPHGSPQTGAGVSGRTIWIVRWLGHPPCLKKGEHPMNVTVLVFLWMFLSLFMVHEFEKALLVGVWRKRNRAYFGTRNRNLTPMWRSSPLRRFPEQ